MGKYTLIITEKPDAAGRIAAALDFDGKAERCFEFGVPYYRAYRGRDLVVVPALGHLYTVSSKKKGQRGYPTFDCEWVPRYLAERGASKIRVWLNAIAKLAEDADSYIDACDFDVEGSIIGYNILKYACGGKEQNAKRMKYSTLTQEELQQSYDSLLPHLDFALVQAGLTRHEVDWIYGINLSRALTSSVKKVGGRYAVLSTGRVQGPTLKFIEDREKTIRCFVPTPYWTMTAKVEIDGAEYEAQFERTLEVKQEAVQIVAACKTDVGKVEAVTTENLAVNPPFPFDSGTLQSEAYRVFRYSPMKTSTIAQRLYIDALISYPRTSSQKLPPQIGYKSILRKLAKMPQFAESAAELLSKPTLKPNEGGRVDSAHPAIYPTGNIPEKTLDTSERNIFDLVVRRFLAVFGEPAVRQNMKATLNINGNKFALDGTQTLSLGWIRLYHPYALSKDSLLPRLKEGQTVTVKRVNLKNELTKPPPRYNPRTLLQKMETENIGTKATRAATIQTLQTRKYICGTDRLSVSDLGFEVSEILVDYCPTVVSSELTRSLEQEMDDIQEGKETKEAILQKAVAILSPVMSELKANETQIGKRLNETLKAAHLAETTVGSCPKCGEGKLVVIRSKKTGKRFVGCTNYFEGKCNVTYPLPQKGTLILLSTSCKTCGSPMVSIWLKVKRPWRLCINPHCPSKETKKP